MDPGHCADAKVAAMLLNLGGMGLRGHTQSGHSSLLGKLGRLHAHDLQEARTRFEVHARTGRSSPSGSDWSVGV